MKKIFRIVTITAVLTSVVLIAACKQFLADPEEFFSYWSSELVSIDYSIDKPSQTIGGVPCVPSANDVTVTVKLKNPKNIKLVTPALSVFPAFQRSPHTALTILWFKPQTINWSLRINRSF